MNAEHDRNMKASFAYLAAGLPILKTKQRLDKLTADLKALMPLEHKDTLTHMQRFNVSEDGYIRLRQALLKGGSDWSECFALVGSTNGLFAVRPTGAFTSIDEILKSAKI